MSEKVRLFDNERLDIPDASALQDLVYEYMGRVLGGLIGGNSGALTIPSVDFGNLSNVAFGNMYLYGITDVDSAYPLSEELATHSDKNQTTGKIIRYDKSRSYQTTQTVDISSSQAAGTSVYLWARRQEVDSDTDNRMRWEGDAEVLVSDQATRKREVVEIATGSFSGTPFSGSGEDAGFRWGRIDWYDDGGTNQPRMVVYSPFDSPRGADATGEITDPINYNGSVNPADDDNDASKASFARFLYEQSFGTNKFNTAKAGGIATLSRAILHAIYEIKGTHDDWIADPSRSLKACDGTLRVLENTCSTMLQTERVTVTAPAASDTPKGGDTVSYKSQKSHFIHTDCFVSVIGSAVSIGEGSAFIGDKGYLQLTAAPGNEGAIFEQPEISSTLARHGERHKTDAEGSSIERVQIKRVSTGKYTVVVSPPEGLPNEANTTSGVLADDYFGQLWQIQSVSAQPASESHGDNVDATQFRTSRVVYRGTLNQIHEAGELDEDWMQVFTNQIQDGIGAEIKRRDKILTIYMYGIDDKIKVPGWYVREWIELTNSEVEALTFAGDEADNWGTTRAYVPIWQETMVDVTAVKILPLAYARPTDPKGAYSFPIFITGSSSSPPNVNSITVEGTVYPGPFPVDEFYYPLRLKHVGGGVLNNIGTALSFSDLERSQNIDLEDGSFYLTIVCSKVPQLGQDFSTSTTTSGPTYTGNDAYGEK